MYGQKKNSGAFLSISSSFCELTELIFVMIPYISSSGYPPKTQGIMGHVQVANSTKMFVQLQPKIISFNKNICSTSTKDNYIQRQYICSTLTQIIFIQQK